MRIERWVLSALLLVACSPSSQPMDAATPDASAADSGSAADLASPPDLSVLVDLSPPPDLRPPPDLAPPPDLTPPPDLARPCDASSLEIMPAPVLFPIIGKPVAVTLKNLSGCPVTVNMMTLAGANAPDFSITMTPNFPVQLAPQATLVVDVVAQRANGTATLTFSTAWGMISVPLMS